MAVEPLQPGLFMRLRIGARAQVGGITGDLVFRLIALGFTLAIVVLAGLLLFYVWDGARPSISEFGFFAFMTTDEWDPVFRDFGALHVIVGTLASSAIAVLLAVPVALGIALFVTELAPPGIRGAVVFLVDILAAIPSIVFGLWGIYVLLPWLVSNVNPLLLDYLGWTPFFSQPAFGFSCLRPASSSRS